MFSLMFRSCRFQYGCVAVFQFDIVVEECDVEFDV